MMQGDLLKSASTVGIARMSAFEIAKRRRNLAEGLQETKGLRDGHCNRRACQKPLNIESHALGQRFYMSDHETFYAGGRLYYCANCAAQFELADIRNRAEKRITVEAC